MQPSGKHLFRPVYFAGLLKVIKYSPKQHSDRFLAIFVYAKNSLDTFTCFSCISAYFVVKMTDFSKNAFWSLMIAEYLLQSIAMCFLASVDVI